MHILNFFNSIFIIKKACIIYDFKIKKKKFIILFNLVWIKFDKFISFHYLNFLANGKKLKKNHSI